MDYLFWDESWIIKVLCWFAIWFCSFINNFANGMKLLFGAKDVWNNGRKKCIKWPSKILNSVSHLSCDFNLCL